VDVIGSIPVGPTFREHPTPRKVADSDVQEHYAARGTLGSMNSRVGRIALVTIGGIAVIIGAVFAGQGLNLIPGSFMTGSRMWLYIGLIVAVVGIILVVLGLRGPRAGSPDK
jgi:uncharacterized membrane protein YdbT with pleckstrin-like domain